MRVLVATTKIPFSRGGAELHAQGLIRELNKRAGVEAELLEIPFSWNHPEKIVDNIMISRLIDASAFNGKKTDLVIGLKFPAYLIRHRNKKIWLLHQHKAAYELWNTPFGDIPDNIMGRTVRSAIRNADTKFICEAKKVFSNSTSVSRRLKKYNGIDSEVLYHPPPNPELYKCESYKNFLVFIGRIEPIKRQLLAVQALNETKADIRLKIIGNSYSEEYLKIIREEIARQKLENRVEIILDADNERKALELANCLACINIPYAEDYGYVTLEALQSSKAVITCSDSDGPAEFVSDTVNGFIAAPTPESIAYCINKITVSEAKRMGANSKKILKEKGISWDNVISRLLE